MSENRKTPSGWEIVKLGEIANYINGKAFKPTEWSKEGLPIIRIQNLNREKSEFNYCNFSVDSKYYVDKGDLLFAWSGTPDTSFGAHIWSGGRAVLNQHIFRIIIDENKITKHYYLYALNHKVKEFVSKAHGTAGLAHITKAKFEESEIILPPLREQHRIVTKIEELFGERDKGVEALKIAQQQLKVYRQAVLKWAFEGKLTEEWRKQQKNLPTASQLLEQNVAEREKQVKTSGKRLKPIVSFTEEELAELPVLPNGWNWVKIEALSDNEPNAIKAGPFGSSLKKEYYVSEGYKIYGQEQVISEDPYYGNYFISKEKYNSLISNEVKPGDVLISLVGTIGKVLILPEDAEPGIINPRLIKISLDSKSYLPKFFKYYFESSFLKRKYSTESQGTTMNILNMSIIKALPFPFLRVDEQNAIIQQIETRLSVADKLEETITQSLQQAEALRQSILKKAFAGQLVPQDPNDEPASKLLERIKAERTAPAPSQKTRKKKAIQ